MLSAMRRRTEPPEELEHGVAPIITGVTPDPRREGTVRIAVAGRAWATLPLAVVQAESLRPGQALDPDLADRLGRAADAEAAYRAVLAALARRSFARADLERRLRQKGHAAAAAAAALERAAGLGLLDDAAFALEYVASKADRGRGPSRVRRELQGMGVEDCHIDAALAERWPSGVDWQSVERLVLRRAGQLGPLPPSALRRRLLGFLARRGYTGHGALGAVEAVLARTDDRPGQ